MKSTGRLNNIALFTMTFLVLLAVSAEAADRVKPRIIFTQDGEGDDQDSTVRFLLYSCDFDVVGIVENNSRFQASGHSRSEWIQKKIDAYAQVLPNLKKHNPDYPHPDYLKSVIRKGNEMGKDLYLHPKDMAAGYTDGNTLTYKWRQYHEAKVEVTKADSQTATFVVPDEPGKQIQIILEVTDDGTPPLTNYQRVFCNIN